MDDDEPALLMAKCETDEGRQLTINERNVVHILLNINNDKESESDL